MRRHVRVVVLQAYFCCYTRWKRAVSPRMHSHTISHGVPTEYPGLNPWALIGQIPTFVGTRTPETLRPRRREIARLKHGGCPNKTLSHMASPTPAFARPDTGAAHCSGPPYRLACRRRTYLPAQRCRSRSRPRLPAGTGGLAGVGVHERRGQGMVKGAGGRRKICLTQHCTRATMKVRHLMHHRRALATLTRPLFPTRFAPRFSHPAEIRSLG